MTAVVRAEEPGARYLPSAEPALLRGFELLATAPGGIANLRSLVIGLAVQGKLVAHDPSDVPIREHDLRPELRAGLTRMRSTELALQDCMPLGWIQARVGDVFTLQYGSSLPAKLRHIGAVPVYGSNGVVGRHDKALVMEPSLVIGRKGSVGAVNVARVEELMKLCDALEHSGRLADEQHARLTSTLFDALAASESAHALAEKWQRVAEHFDLLLDRPEAIDLLERAVLQLAARGLLVDCNV